MNQEKKLSWLKEIARVRGGGICLSRGHVTSRNFTARLSSENKGKSLRVLEKKKDYGGLHPEKKLREKGRPRKQRQVFLHW